MRRMYALIHVMAVLTAPPGCNRDAGSFLGHKLDESVAQFCAIEHTQTEIPAGTPHVVHLYLTVAPLSFTAEESQTEHIEVLSRIVYDQAKE